MRRRTTVITLIGLLALPALALAWNQVAPFHAKVHGHEFSKALVESDGCSVKLKLYFDAPAERYEPADSLRSFYRFHARLRFDAAPNLITGVFNNAAPGSRMYETTLDASADGCWAKTQHKLEGVDIEGCRNRGCTPENFK
ncbi:MAG TPA: hypothetical protein VGI10_25905 [Polyangiaceae bacterium]|jgi:hypothetical protein